MWCDHSIHTPLIPLQTKWYTFVLQWFISTIFACIPIHRPTFVNGLSRSPFIRDKGHNFFPCHNFFVIDLAAVGSKWKYECEMKNSQVCCQNYQTCEQSLFDILSAMPNFTSTKNSSSCQGCGMTVLVQSSIVNFLF